MINELINHNLPSFLDNKEKRGAFPNLRHANDFEGELEMACGADFATENCAREAAVTPCQYLDSGCDAQRLQTENNFVAPQLEISRRAWAQRR